MNNYKKQGLFALLILAVGLFTGNVIAMDDLMIDENEDPNTIRRKIDLLNIEKEIDLLDKKMDSLDAEFDRLNKINLNNISDTEENSSYTDRILERKILNPQEHADTIAAIDVLLAHYRHRQQQ